MTDPYPAITWLTDHGNWPSFSADGSQVVYTQIGQEIGYRIAIVPASGGAVTVLPTGLHASSRPDWSWNPQTIAFTGQPLEGSRERLWLIDADGGNCRPVPMYAVVGNVLYPSWYQDLRSVVVANYFQVDDQIEVRLLQIGLLGTGGITATPLTQPSVVTAGRPSVNPLGTSVVFAGNAGPFNQQHNQLWVVTPPAPATQLDPGQGRSPNWSPDGKWIVFESNRNNISENRFAVFVISAAGGEATQISDDAFAGPHPEWSRDQQKIVFSGMPSNGIGVMDTPAEFLPR